MRNGRLGYSGASDCLAHELALLGVAIGCRLFHSSCPAIFVDRCAEEFNAETLE